MNWTQAPSVQTLRVPIRPFANVKACQPGTLAAHGKKRVLTLICELPREGSKIPFVTMQRAEDSRNFPDNATKEAAA